MRSSRGTSRRGGEGGSWQREAPPGCPGRGVPPPAPDPGRYWGRVGSCPFAPLRLEPQTGGPRWGRGRLRARDDPSHDANAPPPSLAA